MAAKVDKDKCTACGSCVDACAVEAIKVNDDVAVVDEDACIDCAACVDVCCTEAVTVD